MEVDALARPRPGNRRDGQATYTTSKLALIYLTHVLARHVPQGVDVYSFNPGLVLQTSIMREYGPIARRAARLLATPLQHTPLAVSLQESGRRLAEAAVGCVAAPSGSYLDVGRPTRSSAESYDQQREADLWTRLAALTGHEP
jgi:NAD(P)-dependent dehydrogenase (short-subunit alcohol dehydrogenase family)